MAFTRPTLSLLVFSLVAKATVLWKQILCKGIYICVNKYGVSHWVFSVAIETNLNQYGNPMWIIISNFFILIFLFECYFQYSFLLLWALHEGTMEWTDFICLYIRNRLQIHTICEFFKKLVRQRKTNTDRKQLNCITILFSWLYFLMNWYSNCTWHVFIGKFSFFPHIILFLIGIGKSSTSGELMIVQ